MKAARNLQSVFATAGSAQDQGRMDIAIRLKPGAPRSPGMSYDVFEHGADYAVFTFGDGERQRRSRGPFMEPWSAVLLRTLSYRPSKSGPRYSSFLNNVLAAERKVDAQYVTLTVLVWGAAKESPLRDGLTAGGSPPMICRKGQIIKPKVGGVPAGLLDDREYERGDF